MLVRTNDDDALVLALVPFAASHRRQVTYNNGAQPFTTMPLARFHAERYRSL